MMMMTMMRLPFARNKSIKTTSRRTTKKMMMMKKKTKKYDAKSRRRWNVVRDQPTSWRYKIAVVGYGHTQDSALVDDDTVMMMNVSKQ